MRQAAILLATLALAAIAAAQSIPIDAQRSTLTVKVGKSGLFSAFGHDHEIRAPIISGSIVTASAPAVELTVDARRMRVLDPDVSGKDRAEIQKTMESAAVLDVERFPSIHFVSRRIEPAGDNRYRVSGDLTLHGVTRPVLVQLKEVGGRYTGSAKLKQTQFGMKPVTVGGGTVKVKDEVEVMFDIVPQQ
jgi:polyisoprenoid-binding protein YceI